LPKRLTFTALHRCPEERRDVTFRRGIALDHLDALARLEAGKIGRRCFHFRIGDRLGKGDHQARRQTASDGGAAHAALIVSHLSDDVALRKTCEVSVFRTPRPVGAVTKPAGEYVGLAAVSYDVRQRPMVARVPDRCDESVPELAPGITGRAVRHTHNVTVIDRRLVVGIVLRISPPWRRVARCGRRDG
jgi:hypothetical protein